MSEHEDPRWPSADEDSASDSSPEFSSFGFPTEDPDAEYARRPKIPAKDVDSENLSDDLPPSAKAGNSLEATPDDAEAAESVAEKSHSSETELTDSPEPRESEKARSAGEDSDVESSEVAGDQRTNPEDTRESQENSSGEDLAAESVSEPNENHGDKPEILSFEDSRFSSDESEAGEAEPTDEVDENAGQSESARSELAQSEAAESENEDDAHESAEAKTAEAKMAGAEEVLWPDATNSEEPIEELTEEPIEDSDVSDNDDIQETDSNRSELAGKTGDETEQLSLPPIPRYWFDRDQIPEYPTTTELSLSKLDASAENRGSENREQENPQSRNSEAGKRDSANPEADNPKADERDSDLWDTRSWSVPEYFAHEDSRHEVSASADPWDDDRPTMDHRLGSFGDDPTSEFPIDTADTSNTSDTADIADTAEQTAYIPRPVLAEEHVAPRPFYYHETASRTEGYGSDSEDRSAIPSAQHAMPVRIEPSDESRSTRANEDGEVDELAGNRAERQEAQLEKPQAEPAGENLTGYSGGAKAPGPVKPKPRRGRRLVLTGLALLLVVAVAVVLALPTVSNRLALPWAPNAPKTEPPQPVAVTKALRAPDSSAATPTANGVRSALSDPAHNSVLGTLTGSVVDPASGTQLWDQNADQLLTPASTTKLLTVSAALLAIDHGKQLTTKVVAGDDPGTVVLVGGGDPTLSSLPEGKESIYPGAAHLDDLVAQVKAATGGRVTKVQLDLSAYTGARTAPGWAPEDAPSTYAAPVTAAMLDGGRTSAVDEKAMRNGDPSGVLISEFARRLGNVTVQSGSVKAPKDAKVLGEVRSAPLTELVDNLLLSSDDLLADAIMRQTAIALGEEPSFAGGARATLKVLSQNGFDVSQVKLSDGSGLSTLNKVPAGLLSEIMAVAAAPDGKDPKTVKLRPLLEGLPVAGGSGTLSTRYLDSSSATGKGWVRAKTGSLSGVNTLAGLVLDQDGRVLVFALMSSSPAPADNVRAALDSIVAKLRGCGCQ